MLALASPLFIRFALQAELGGMLSVAIGGIFIVSFGIFYRNSHQRKKAIRNSIFLSYLRQY